MGNRDKPLGGGGEGRGDRFLKPKMPLVLDVSPSRSYLPALGPHFRWGHDVMLALFSGSFPSAQLQCQGSNQRRFGRGGVASSWCPPIACLSGSTRDAECT